MLPAEILDTVGLPLVSDPVRSVPLTYVASRHGRVLAEASVTLTFGPTNGTVKSAPAPIVDPVVRGATPRVRYDITGLTGATDLTARTGTAHTFGGGTYWHPAVDSGRGLFLMQETVPPDFSGGSPNNNAASAVVVIDEQGNLVRRIEAFNFFNVFLLNAGAYVQVSPATGAAYTLGPGGAQLYPFEYAGSW